MRTVSLICKGLLRQADLQVAAPLFARQQPESHLPAAHQGSQCRRHIVRQLKSALPKLVSNCGQVLVIHTAATEAADYEVTVPTTSTVLYPS